MAAKKKDKNAVNRSKGGVRTGQRPGPSRTAEKQSEPAYDVGKGKLRTSVTAIDQHRNHKQGPQRQAQQQVQPSGRRPQVKPDRNRQAQARAATAPAPQAAAKAAPRVHRYYDFYLLIAVLAIFTIGLLMVYSSSQYTAMMDGQPHDYYFKRQLIIGGAGFFAILVCSLMSGLVIRALRVLAVPALAVTTFLTLLTLLVGASSHGATRWLRIGGVSIQTAEIAKVAIIMFMAAMVDRKGFAIGRFRKNWRILLYVGIPSILITMENLSSGIIMFGICFVMYFVGSKNWKLFVFVGIAGIVALIVAKPLTAYIVEMRGIVNIEEVNYRLRRILAWACPEQFPDDAYQTLQGLYAIGSGGLTGQGLGESIQKFGALPEAQNDMIFSIICEELGFVGAFLVVTVYLFIIFRLYDIARYARDLFSSMLCVGVMAHISIQVILNIAVVTGFIPNTGVTLPFISYGGSAVLCTLGEIGIALAVSHEILTDS